MNEFTGEVHSVDSKDVYRFDIPHRPRSLVDALKRPVCHIDAEKELLLKAPLSDKLTALASQTHRKGDPSLVCIVYHKTGTVFSMKLLRTLREQLSVGHALQPCKKGHSFCENLALLRNTTDSTFHIDTRKGSFKGGSQQWSLGALDYQKVLPGFYRDAGKLDHPTKLFLAVKPSTEWNPPTSSRVVHWVRDPVDMITSAYRYLTEGQEHWMFQTMHCNYCDQRALQVMADACQGLHDSKHCTFHNIVHSVNETEGVLYVAMVLQRQIQDMVDNVYRWASDPNVLQLSVRALGKDFDGTVGCLLHFAGIDTAHHSTLLPEIQKLDVHRKTNAHVTAGKYDNSAIQEFLRSQPVWRDQFAQFSQALEKVSSRQQTVYGCPSIL